MNNENKYGVNCVRTGNENRNEFDKGINNGNECGINSVFGTRNRRVFPLVDSNFGTCYNERANFSCSEAIWSLTMEDTQSDVLTCRKCDDDDIESWYKELFELAENFESSPSNKVEAKASRNKLCSDVKVENDNGEKLTSLVVDEKVFLGFSFKFFST